MVERGVRTGWCLVFSVVGDNGVNGVMVGRIEK